MRYKERGAALLLTLVLVAAVAAVSLSLTLVMTRATQMATAAQVRDAALWGLLGAEQAAMALLDAQWQAQPNIDLRTEEWLRQPYTYAVAGGIVRGAFTDASNCFNVTSLVVRDDDGQFAANEEAVDELAQLVEAMGGDRRAGEGLAQTLADFMDTDADPLPNGAEDGIYQLAPVPYMSAGGPVSDYSEARAVLGWTQEAFTALEDVLCLNPEGLEPSSLNLNTMSRGDAPLLYAAIDGEVPLSPLQAVLDAPPAGGYASVGDFLSVPTFSGRTDDLPADVDQRLSTFSKFIAFSSQVTYDQQVFRMTSLIVNNGDGDYKVVQRWIGEPDL